MLVAEKAMISAYIMAVSYINPATDRGGVNNYGKEQEEEQGTTGTQQERRA
jgi:hypothetical protein